MKENVRPTRMELINTRQKLKLAEKGHRILQQKRDALIMEFFKIIKQAKDLRNDLNQELAVAFEALAVARAFHPDVLLKVNATTANKVPEIEVYSKNVMGVRIPGIKGSGVERALLDRGYSVVGSSAKIDWAAQKFEGAVNKIIALAETETALKRLLGEIEKTNRRVNALEFNVQPEMKQTLKEIKLHLNRLESEQFFALKVTKQRLEAKGEWEFTDANIDRA